MNDENRIKVPFNNFTPKHILTIYAAYGAPCLFSAWAAYLFSSHAFFCTAFSLIVIYGIYRALQITVFDPEFIEIDFSGRNISTFHIKPLRMKNRKYSLDSFSYCVASHTACRPWVLSKDISLGGRNGELKVARFKASSQMPEPEEANNFQSFIQNKLGIKALWK